MTPEQILLPMMNGTDRAVMQGLIAALELEFTDCPTNVRQTPLYGTLVQRYN